MGCIRMILRFAAPMPRVDAFDRYLFVGPHPDDIEIGAGATVARLCALGKKVCFLICTDGRFGMTNAPSGISEEALAQMRKEEAIRGAKTLGVTDVRFLDLRDGAGYTFDALKSGIARTVSDFQPEILFAPDPQTGAECHPDHLQVGCASREIACMAPYPGIMAGYGVTASPVRAIAFYMTAHPNRYVPTGPYRPRQRQAIACHASQYPEGCSDLASLSTYLPLRSFVFGLRSRHKGAEGFRMLDSLRMHCLPEAGL